MLSTAEIARITAAIAALEKFRDRCADTGILLLIQQWIEDEKDKLEAERRAS